MIQAEKNQITPKIPVQLIEKEKLSNGELVTTFGGNPNVSQTKRDMLISQGYLKQVGVGKHNTKYYALTEEGRNKFFWQHIQQFEDFIFPPLKELSKFITPLDKIDDNKKSFVFDDYRSELQQLDKLMSAQDSPNQRSMKKRIMDDMDEIQIALMNIEALSLRFSMDIRTFDMKPQFIDSKGNILTEKPLFFNYCLTCLHHHTEYVESPCHYCNQTKRTNSCTSEHSVEKPTQWKPKDLIAYDAKKRGYVVHGLMEAIQKQRPDIVAALEQTDT